MPKLRLRWRFLTTILLIELAMPAQFALAYRVAIVLDEDLAPYRKVTAGIRAQTRMEIQTYYLQESHTSPEKTLDEAKMAKPDLYVAVGPKSANALQKKTQTVPIIFCMVPRPEEYALIQPNIVGVRLEQSRGAQISLMKELFPSHARIGVMYHPRMSADLVEEMRKSLEGQQRKIVAIKVPDPKDAARVLKGYAGEIDLLWMLSDPSALHMESFDASLQFCFANKVPFVALSEAFVAKGALLGVSADYLNLGRQVGQLANEILFENLDIKKLTLLDQDVVHLSLNMKTAEKIGLGAQFAGDVLQVAAKHSYAVMPLSP